MSELSFFVPGEPVPFTRMVRGDRRRQALRYRAYRDQVGWAARQAGAEPWDSPVHLEVVIYTSDRLERQWDADNVFKGISDALNKVAFVDDKQVTSGRFEVYTAVDAEPGVQVTLLKVT